MTTRQIRVGITHGDINGIGYEVILKTLEDSRILELCTPIVYGSAKIAAHYRKMLEMPNVPFVQIASPDEAKDGANNIINVIGEDVKIEPGVSSAVAGEAAFVSLERAVGDLRDGKIDVLVTSPINKANIQSDTFTFPGHTEYLESAIGEGAKALMVLCSENMRVALVTTHMPISEVPRHVTKEVVLEKLKTFNRSLIADFGIHSPRIAVLSLNPHAGEGGMLGTEEHDVIIPAIEEAKQGGIWAFGPYAADGFFGAGRFVKFDGILAMYHDQGLAPFKSMSMDTGVNFTAGLPFIRTSPDHGTGYDIVGSGEASPESLRQAIYAAIDIFRCRERESEATARPLKKQSLKPEKKQRPKADKPFSEAADDAKKAPEPENSGEVENTENS